MAIRGKIFVTLLLVLTLVALTPAFGQDKEKLGDAWWTGPLETPNPNVIPKGHLYMETYFVVEQDNGVYNSKGTKIGGNAPGGGGYDNAFQSVTLFQYGVAKNFNFAMLPVFYGVQAKSNSESTPGGQVGGLIIRTPYQLLRFKQGSLIPSLSITPGVNTPVASGNGNVWTPWVGLWVQEPFWMPGGRILRVRAAQDFYFPLQGQTFAPSTGVCSGTGITSCSINKGDFQKTMIGMEYSLTKHWVPAWDFYWQYGSRTTQSVNNLASVTKSPSYNYFAVDPALEYNFTGDVGIIFGAEVTVSGRNAQGYIAPQIAVQWFK